MSAGLLGSKSGVSHSEQEPGNWPRQMVRSRGHTRPSAASASHGQVQKPILCDSYCFMHLAICGCLPKGFPVVQCSLLRILAHLWSANRRHGDCVYIGTSGFQRSPDRRQEAEKSLLEEEPPEERALTWKF